MPGAGSGNPAARAQWGLLSEQVHGQMGGSWLTGCSKLPTREAGTEPRGLTVIAKVLDRTGLSHPSLCV